MITVAMADDHAIILNGLQKILSDLPDIEVINTYSNGETLLAGLAIRQPDVLLIDIQMPGQDGVELAGIIHKTYPSVSMIALTNLDTPSYIKKMLMQGCSGYLLKDSSSEVLEMAIRKVYSGQQFLGESVSRQLLGNMLSFGTNNLTKREKEILRLITEEFTSQQIADKLFLSLRTVENYRNNLLQKLEVKNTAGLVKIALQQGLI